MILRFSFVSFLAVFSFFSCGNEGEYNIKGHVSGRDGEMVYLEQLNEEKLDYSLKDSAEIRDGFFLFKGVSFEPDIRYIRFKDVKERLTVLLENEVEIEVAVDSLVGSKVIEGDENRFLFEYNLKSAAIRKESYEFQKKNTKLMLEAKKKNNKRVVDSLLKLNSAINSKYVENMNEQLTKYPNSYVSLKLIDGLFSYPNVRKNEIEFHYNKLNEKYKNFRISKIIKQKLDTLKR